MYRPITAARQNPANAIHSKRCTRARERRSEQQCADNDCLAEAIRNGAQGRLELAEAHLDDAQFNEPCSSDSQRTTSPLKARAHAPFLTESIVPETRCRVSVAIGRTLARAHA